MLNRAIGWKWRFQWEEGSLNTQIISGLYTWTLVWLFLKVVARQMAGAMFLIKVEHQVKNRFLLLYCAPDNK